MGVLGGQTDQNLVSFHLGEFRTVAPTPFKLLRRIMFYVYILKSRIDGQLYFGSTSNLKRRFHEHNSGKNRATKGRKPFDLVYYEAYRARADALRRERMLKLDGRALGQLKRRLVDSLLEA